MYISIEMYLNNIHTHIYADSLDFFSSELAHAEMGESVATDAPDLGDP